MAFQFHMEKKQTAPHFDSGHMEDFSLKPRNDSGSGYKTENSERRGRRKSRGGEEERGMESRREVRVRRRTKALGT